jgi:hypothetical protein
LKYTVDPPGASVFHEVERCGWEPMWWRRCPEER